MNRHAFVALTCVLYATVNKSTSSMRVYLEFDAMQFFTQ